MKPILIIAAVILAASCSKEEEKCPKPADKRVTLSLSENNKLTAFKGYDTIPFANGKGDTMYLYGSEKTLTTPFRNKAIANCGEADFAYYREECSITFSGSSPLISYVKLKGYYDFLETLSEQISLTINSDTYSQPAIMADSSNMTKRIEINRKNYLYVLLLKSPDVYYNPQKGILRIDDPDGEIWTLAKP